MIRFPIITLLALSVFSSLAIFSCTKEDIPTGSFTGEVVSTTGGGRIKSFLFDDDGFVWMSCESQPCLLKTDEAEIIRYTHTEDDPGSLSSDQVNDCIIDDEGTAWFATQKGVDRYDKEKGCFEHLKLDGTNSYVVSIAASPERRICIATRRNILELDSTSNIFLRKLELPLLTLREPSVCFDKEGKLWVRTDEGLECYGPGYDLLYSNRFDAPIEFSFFDGLHTIWVEEGGELLLLDTATFKSQKASRVYPELFGLTPESISLVREGFVLVKAKEESICIDVGHSRTYDMGNASGLMKKLLENSRKGSPALAFGPRGGLWAAHSQGGYIHYPSIEGPISRYENLTELLTLSSGMEYVLDMRHFWFLSGSSVHCFDIAGRKPLGSVDVSRHLDGAEPYALQSSPDGRIIVSGPPRRSAKAVILALNKGKTPIVSETLQTDMPGIFAFDGHNDIIFAGIEAHLFQISDGGKEEIALPFKDNATYASHIARLSDGRVLVCYTDHSPMIYDPKKNEVLTLDIPGLKQAFFNTSAQDGKGNLWIGSTDNGLFRYSGTDKIIHKIADFPEPQVTSLAIDGDGNVFAVGSKNTVYLFAAGTQEARVIWTDTSEYPSARRAYTLPDNSVVFAGEGGYVWFNREELSSQKRPELPAHVILTSGKKVLTTFSPSSYSRRKATIRLSRKTEGLNLHLGPVPGSYGSATSYSYMYKIGGFKTGPRESFNNSYIPLYGVSGIRNKVRFWIRDNNRGTNSDDFTLIVRMNLLWSEVLITLFIILLLGGSSVLGYIMTRKKREAGEERMKREMTEKMNMENIDFFANISHEFRTPLTLIHGAVSSLEYAPAADAAKSRGIIRRNTDRLLKLVSQLLDFNKLDHGVLKLNVKMESVSEILRQIKMDFEIGASLKNLDLSLKLPEKDIKGMVDRDKLEKILYNLSSNALKYTPPGGKVEILAYEDENHVLNVSVSDTGIGIPEEDLDSVFDRFYQANATRKSGGTGIGLYYTKALVTLHHGKISVALRKTDDGKTAGSIFSFFIPLSESEYSGDEKAEAADRIVSIDNKEMMSEFVHENPTPGNDASRKRKLLLIDDDYEIVYYLKSIFSDDYDVSFRFDAMSGYKLVEELAPDLIICDIMMVDVDGIQLCKIVKGNTSMCHIPIIMLTAKSTMEDQIKSLGAGADAYVVKPFNTEYLKALVKTTLDNRDRVKEMLTRSINMQDMPKETLGDYDRAFMESLYSAMKDSLQKGELDIDSTAEELSVSRSKFYYKLKALTGQTPNEFFTTYKLNYSVELLKARKYKIAAIAEMLGFSSASHFAAIFKKRYGVLPSQYLNGDAPTMTRCHETKKNNADCNCSGIV